MKKIKFLGILLAALIAFPIFTNKASAYTIRAITFPVIGHTGYSNDFYAPRSGGRTHHATDIFGVKMLRLVAAVNGVVTFAPATEPSYGWMITIRDDQGYKYNYIHINNDTPGTDNGRGGAMNAYTFDIAPGSRVVAGQHIGWLGDSGNAESTPPHLHFEIETPQGAKANPFYSLNQAKKISKPVLAPQQDFEILPFGKTEQGVHISVDSGNFDADSEPEIIAASGHKFNGPKVRVYNNNYTTTNVKIDNPFPGFLGELDVAAADIDGDGLDEIAVVQGKGGTPLVKIFSRSGTLLHSFYAYFEGYKHGIRVSAADIDGDGKDEIITGTMSGLAPVVRVFKPNGTMLKSFYAYDKNFKGGIDVAAGDINGDGTNEIVVGDGVGGKGEVRIFSGAGSLVRTFLAYGGSFKAGLRVSVGNVRKSSVAEEIVVAIEQGSPSIGLFNGQGQKIDGKFFFESWWRGFNDIAAGDGVSYAASGINRRATIRNAFQSGSHW